MKLQEMISALRARSNVHVWWIEAFERREHERLISDMTLSGLLSSDEIIICVLDIRMPGRTCRAPKTRPRLEVLKQFERLAEQSDEAPLLSLHKRSGAATRTLIESASG